MGNEKSCSGADHVGKQILCEIGNLGGRACNENICDKCCKQYNNCKVCNMCKLSFEQAELRKKAKPVNSGLKHVGPKGKSLVMKNEARKDEKTGEIVGWAELYEMIAKA